MAKYIADIPDIYVVKDGYVNIPFSFADSGDYMVETNIKVEPYDDEVDDEVKNGDEMAIIKNPEVKVCVTRLCDGETFTGFAIKDVPLCCMRGEAYSFAKLKSWRKTGKHYPEIAKLFGDLKKEQYGEN